MTRSLAEKVTALQQSIETGDDSVLRATLHPTSYRQHNPSIATGADAIAAVHDQLPHDKTYVNVVRAFGDGDIAVVHVDYHLFERTTAFDVHRFEGDRSVEHWDNLQPTPEGRNPSGRTMTDGKTQVVDRDRTDANKDLARRFTEEVLIGGGDAAGFVEGDALVQHAPYVGDGLQAWLDVRRTWTAAGEPTRHDTVHRVLGEGSFVLVMSEGVFRGRPSAYFDLYRLAGGRIVEHWDVVEDIPPLAERKNDKGKF